MSNTKLHLPLFQAQQGKKLEAHRTDRTASHRRWWSDVNELEPRCLLSVQINVRYDFDSNHFFDTPAKQAVMERAAETLSGMLDDSLAAITPSGENQWLGTFMDPANPSSGNPRAIENLNVPADTIIVFVGGCNLGYGVLGAGGPGGGIIAGSQDWFNLVKGRGEPGALATPATDFDPWGGSIAFNTTGVNWYFGQTTAGIQSSQYDFYSVALHELGHVLGFGGAPSWTGRIWNSAFCGPASMAAYGGVPVPLTADGGHWAQGVTSDGVNAAMGPSCRPDQRNEFTTLDFAGLTDVGWSVPHDYLRFSSPTYTVSEAAGTATISVVRAGDASNEVSVHYATADSTARAGEDYAAVSGTLTFGPGETTKTFDVPIIYEPLIEGTEGLDLVLSDPVGIRTYGSPSLAALQIIDVPPPPPTVSISDASIVEGNSGMSYATFSISLSVPSPNSASVIYSTANGTAKAGSDYVAITPTVLTFNPWEVTKKVTVAVKGDRLSEPDETFFVNLASPVQAIIARGRGVGTILNDDNRITVNNVRVSKPRRGTTLARFSVRLSSPARFPVSVTCSTVDGSASAGSDYMAMAPTTITFRPGQTLKIVTVQVKGDTIREPNETFSLKLSNSTNALIAVGTGIATIVNPRVKAGVQAVTLGTTPAPPKDLLDAALASLRPRSLLQRWGA